VGGFLLDANVLIALVWPRHEFHGKVGTWFARHSRAGWSTCPFTQAAFVRILCNPAFSSDALTPGNAIRLLEANINLPHHQFWPDSLDIPKALHSIGVRLNGHQQVTDAYLLAIASHHRGRLATLDRAIPVWAGKAAVEVVE
jgi:hypothetical protein